MGFVEGASLAQELSVVAPFLFFLFTLGREEATRPIFLSPYLPISSTDVCILQGVFK